ncbi:MAG TPA: DNA-3-methyladenine glycosylase I [Armatimonadota bacterium]|jgi:DNA-3-methyladenine glycosylase I
MTVSRCAWVPCHDAGYLAYHDTEWGVPVHDDRLLFEYLVLEAAQAGLSWQIVLRKREHYRRAFDGFAIARVAGYDAAKVEALLQDAGIVRHRKKIAAAVTLAQVALEIQREAGSLDTFLWAFVDGQPQQPERRTLADIPTRSPAAEAMSAALRARGVSFVGATICYSFMQAVGMVNDHTVDCFRQAEIQRIALGHPAL